MAHTVHDINLGGTSLRQVSNVSHSDNGSVPVARASGEVDPSEQYGGNTEDVTTLTSGDLETLVALNSGTFVSAGLCVTATASEVPFKARADCSTFETGMSHPALSGSNCLVIPTQFQVSQEGEEGAQAQVEIHWKSTDGITAAVTGSTGNTLAAVAFNAMFGMGKAFVNAVEIPEVQQITVNPGITVQAQRQSGGIWPVAIYIVRREPTIEIVTEDLDAAMSRVGYLGAGGNVDAYFRKKRDGSVFELDASLEHVRFRFADGLQRTNSISVSDTGNGTGTITVHGKSLVSASGVAIP